MRGSASEVVCIAALADGLFSLLTPQQVSRGGRGQAGAGSAPYMAPEAWDSELGPATAASDAYSAAATLCFAASGRALFGGKSAMQVMADVVALGRFPEVPESMLEPLRSAVRGALVGRPGERTSVAQMLRAARESR